MSEVSFNHSGYVHWLNQHRVMAARCQRCGALHLPPRQLCPACFGREMAWESLSGRGRLQAFTAVYVAPSRMIAAGYGRDNPYLAGVVQLEEGPAISAQILGLDPRHPERIALDTPLQATFVEREEGEGGAQAAERVTYLAFEPI